MSLQNQITEQLKAAMKAKDSVRLSTIRSIKAAFTNELVSLKRTPQDSLSDDEALAVITRLAKQRKDSIEQYKAGGRDDLVEEESKELVILEEFLPEMMSKEEVEKIVKAKIEEIPIALSDGSEISIVEFKVEAKQGRFILSFSVKK